MRDKKSMALVFSLLQFEDLLRKYGLLQLQINSFGQPIQVFSLTEPD